MLSQAQETTQFFEMFDEAIRARRRKAGDSRAHPREPFPVVQLIAPRRGTQPIPPRAAFESVRCFDLSAAGFAFITSVPPLTEELFVALGTETQFKYLTARVAHQTPLTLVGCEFTGRV